LIGYKAGLFTHFSKFKYELFPKKFYKAVMRLSDDLLAELALLKAPIGNANNPTKSINQFIGGSFVVRSMNDPVACCGELNALSNQSYICLFSVCSTQPINKDGRTMTSPNLIFFTSYFCGYERSTGLLLIETFESPSNPNEKSHLETGGLF